MYEEHEDGSFTLHMCEWYEQGRRLVGEYETLGDGSGAGVPVGMPAPGKGPSTRRRAWDGPRRVRRRGAA